MSKLQAVAAWLPTAWKAVVGFVAPGAAVIGTSVLPDSPGGTSITSGEWITAGVAAVITAAAVYGAPKNRERVGD